VLDRADSCAVSQLEYQLPSLCSRHRQPSVLYSR